jgi:hypothetical protein
MERQKTFSWMVASIPQIYSALTFLINTTQDMAQKVWILLMFNEQGNNRPKYSENKMFDNVKTMQYISYIHLLSLEEPL